jgi:hypothetical protein
MAGNNDFENFLANQSQKAKSHGNVDERKQAWFAKIEELYSKTEQLLRKYTRSGNIQLTRGSVTIHEQLLGSYQVETLKLNLRFNNAEFKPVGTYLFGSPGRVDLTGRSGTVRFVLVPPDIFKPSLIAGNLTRNKGASRAEIEKPLDIGPYVWKISTNPPAIRYSEITEKSLTDAIMAVANGR